MILHVQQARAKTFKPSLFCMLIWIGAAGYQHMRPLSNKKLRLRMQLLVDNVAVCEFLLGSCVPRHHYGNPGAANNAASYKS